MHPLGGWIFEADVTTSYERRKFYILVRHIAKDYEVSKILLVFDYRVSKINLPNLGPRF